ncbi:probable prephenate dehydrogenase (NADP) [Cephalotrichum gorgonifer]|uniref:Prephenate dehydrogenase [NADP(+)] n=1 Tax=Cephalotrichum gorgonifer TaxID=2041049 RepID=A0AAE8MYH0_9PEZI|nr:probable prephenate dehydrogenase (NADP) [Cephalotrichum gorgonifer]
MANPVPPRPAGMENFVVGLIGMGDMGRMYANRLSAAGWSILACDKDDDAKVAALTEEFATNKNVKICRNGSLVSRSSDYILYNVEAAAIDKVVEMYGQSTKVGAIVGGQTSCKDPEIKAFERWLPADVDIVSCHSLHGPQVDSRGQPLVIIQHRASAASLAKVEAVLACLNSKIVYLSAHDHDLITANTQAATHVAFLSMGKAWHANRQFPWALSRYVGGIENVKINIMLRIYSQKWHVYAGLAILNPQAKKQISQYAASVTDLYKLMLEGDHEALRSRVYAAKEKVFGPEQEPKWARRQLLRPELLDRFTLRGDGESGEEDEVPAPNNHLSLLAMVDCWAALGIVPYDHMLCSTPLFRIFLGVTEHLFRNKSMLDDAIRIAIEDLTFRSDDLEFTFAARAWAECVEVGHFETWRDRFMSTERFFQPRFKEAVVVGNRMMKAVLEDSTD